MAFILQHPASLLFGFFEQADRQMVFKGGLRVLRLQRAAKRRAAVVGVTFQIDTVRARSDQLSFAITGTAANQHDRALHQFVGGLDRCLA